MQKWRHDYLLKLKRLNLKPKKNRTLDDQAGFTLIELLAAISILSVVILLAGSIHIFGQRQFIAQSESAAQANDMSHTLTVMTTDLRKLESEKVTIDNENKIIVDKEALYSVEGGQLKKGGTVLAEEVTAQFIKDENENSITIIIENIVESGLKKKYETTIYFRR